MRLEEAIEELPHGLRSDPRPRIGNADQDMTLALGSNGHADRTTRGDEFERVLHQVADHLGNAQWVDTRPQRLGRGAYRDAQPAELRARAQALDHFTDEDIQARRLAAHGKAPQFDA